MNPKELANLILKSKVENKIVFKALWVCSDTGKSTLRTTSDLNYKNKFLKSQYLGKNPTRDKLKNDDFFELEENIQELNTKWLKNHPDLKVLSIENMFLELEQFLGREIER